MAKILYVELGHQLLHSRYVFRMFLSVVGPGRSEAELPGEGYPSFIKRG